MPALIPTRCYGTITWLGYVPDRTRGLRADPVASLDLTFAGAVGAAQTGMTRRSCSRVTAQYPKGTEIRNTRQLSVLSAEELAGIAEAMGLAALDPALIGANMVVEGIPDFSHLPPSSRLQAEGGATLVVDMENRPCTVPVKTINADPATDEAGRLFKAAAKGRRGITAWVEREGQLRLGEKLCLHIPDQPAWRGVGGEDQRP
ncbi:MAG: MOSC domain-containing protein [Qingshengfaniella sp.]